MSFESVSDGEIPLTQCGLKKVRALRPGDRVAIVSPSSGVCREFPERFRQGWKSLEEELELEVTFSKHCQRDTEWLLKNPRARADDLHEAFLDSAIRAVFCSNGGDASISVLPYLDNGILREHTKAFIGASDTGVFNFALWKAGVVSFYGSNIFGAFAENGGMHSYFSQNFRPILFEDFSSRIIPQNSSGWTSEATDWSSKEALSAPRRMQPPLPWKFLNGENLSRGHLIGGCLEVVDWLRGTEVWPDKKDFKDAVLFLETSYEAPPPLYLKRVLRVFGALGILQSISGLIFGRPGGNISQSGFAEYDEVIRKVVIDEMGLNTLNIVTHFDVGHSDPTLTIPVGAEVEIDPVQKQIKLIESVVY